MIVVSRRYLYTERKEIFESGAERVELRDVCQLQWHRQKGADGYKHLCAQDRCKRHREGVDDAA